MATLYKDHECTIPAICPMSYNNPLLASMRPFECDTSCAWCKERDTWENIGCGTHGCFANEQTDLVPLWVRETDNA